MAYNARRAGPCLSLFTAPPSPTPFVHWTSTTVAICPLANPGERLGFLGHFRETSSRGHRGTQIGRLTAGLFLQWRKIGNKRPSKEPAVIIIVYSYHERYGAQIFF